MAMPRPIRADISRADFNQGYIAFLSLQVFAMSVGVWISTGHIAVGALTFGVLAVVLASRHVMLVILPLSLCWGATGGLVGNWISIEYGVVFAVLGMSMSFVMNHAAAQYLRDVSADEQLKL